MAASEARTATILVTDLAGSTRIRVEVGEDHADRLRRAHDALLSEQANAHGGSVVKGLGDGLLVAFAGAAEALASAVAMQQALAAFSVREGVGLKMRVGLAAGDVAFESDDCFGTPVIEAARLCAAAHGGQILVADMVRLLARGRSAAGLVAVGPMTLKGLPEPLEVWEVSWEPIRQVVDLRATTPYVGRDRELELLRVCWSSAASGSGGLVLVSGEPGIGKTRLVSELCEQVVRPAGGLVLFGSCHDGDVVANAPFVEALTDWVRGSAVEVVAETLGLEAPVVARMAPAIVDALPDVAEPLAVPRDAEVARLHDAVGQALLRMSGTTPVVLVVDDLQWADDATVGMLRAVSRTARRGALLVIGTYRETDLDRRHPFAQALPLLQREVEPTRVALSGLDVTDVHALLERLAQHDVPDAFATMLATETEGNPFFVRETLLHLVEEGELRVDDGAWTLAGSLGELGIPAGIRDVIGRRLSRLPNATNRLLSAGALFEVAFPLPVAAEVAGLDEDAGLDAIDAALAARIVDATDAFDEYSFTHALFRHALVEELNPSRQVRMHRTIATTLERRLRGAPTPAEAATLARHYHRSAALPNAERGVPHALAAADDAVRRYARREEFDALTMALELLPEGDERAPDLNVRRAQSAIFANIGTDRVLSATQAAGELIRARGGDDAACDFVAELAMECVGLDDLRVAWMVAAAARRWLRAERRDRTYLMLRNLELSEREFNDPEHSGFPLDTPERRELRELFLTLTHSELFLFSYMFGSRAEALGVYESAGAHHRESLWPMWVLGAHRELRDLLRDQIDDALARGVIPQAVFDLALLARIHGVLGEHDDAHARVEQGLALLPRISETSNPAFQILGAFALERLIRGEVGNSETVVDFAPYGESPDVRWVWVVVTAGRGIALAQEGKADDAIAVLHEVLPVVERAGGWAPNYPWLLHEVTLILWRLERTDQLEVVERNLRAKVVEPDVRYPETDGRWMLALLCALDGRVNEARDWFDQARRVLTEQGSESLLVALDYDEAVMNQRLAGPEDLVRALGLLARARGRCAHPALAPWIARIDELSTRIRR